MSSVLRISEAASMGLHAVVLLSADDSQPTATKCIAERLKCSEAHLSKVLQRLTRSGILSATRGPRGGFVLAREPKSITLMEIMETIDGKPRHNGCLFEHSVCDGDKCMMGDLLKDVNKRVNEYFANTTIDKVDCMIK